MHPILFSAGPVTIYSYGVLLASAYLLGWSNSLGEPSTSLRAIEQSLLALCVAHIHNVQPLTRADTGELVRHAFGVDDSVARDFSTLLYTWTRGNVFFLKETRGKPLEEV